VLRVRLFIFFFQLSPASDGFLLHDDEFDVFSFAGFEELVGVEEDEVGSRGVHVGLVVVLTSVNPALLISLRMREAVSLVE